MAEKSKKDGGQRYDWNLIMTDYVTDAGSSLRKIAEKYGIRFTTVKEKAKADSWFATKQEYQKKIRTKAATKVATKKANQLAKELESVDNISDRILKMLNDDPQQFNRHILQLETPVILDNGKVGIRKEPIEVVYDKLDSRALKDIAQSLKLIEDMKRSMLDLQRLEQRQRYEFEREKLELEKERLALERERNALRNGNIGSDNDKHYGVVLIPEVIDNE